MVVLLCLFQTIYLRLNLKSSFMLRVVYFYRKLVIASHSYLHVQYASSLINFHQPSGCANSLSKKNADVIECGFQKCCGR